MEFTAAKYQGLQLGFEQNINSQAWLLKVLSLYFEIRKEEKERIDTPLSDKIRNLYGAKILFNKFKHMKQTISNIEARSVSISDVVTAI